MTSNFDDDANEMEKERKRLKWMIRVMIKDAKKVLRTS